ncbi:MAG TPA: NUDIX hydrolase [Solirubrobacteraceae bacterium]|nr:NUDIX hydrolase [Solirubrobacteraceae bacterium]
MPVPRVTSTRVVYENHWMRLHEDRLERPDGSPGLYAWVEKPPGALIVPLDDDHVWLVEQYRHPVGRRFWEFPQGAWEAAPDAPAEELARGELAEETGLRAREMERLGTLYYAYGLLDQRFDVWLATGLEPGPPAPEPTEQDLRCARFPTAELEAMIRRGEIPDAATIAAWHLVSRR